MQINQEDNMKKLYDRTMDKFFGLPESKDNEKPVENSKESNSELNSNRKGSFPEGQKNKYGKNFFTKKDSSSNSNAFYGKNKNNYQDENFNKNFHRGEKENFPRGNFNGENMRENNKLFQRKFNKKFNFQNSQKSENNSNWNNKNFTSIPHFYPKSLKENFPKPKNNKNYYVQNHNNNNNFQQNSVPLPSNTSNKNMNFPYNNNPFQAQGLNNNNNYKNSGANFNNSNNFNNFNMNDMNHMSLWNYQNYQNCPKFSENFSSMENNYNNSGNFNHKNSKGEKNKKLEKKNFKKISSEEERKIESEFNFKLQEFLKKNSLNCESPLEIFKLNRKMNFLTIKILRENILSEKTQSENMEKNSFGKRQKKFNLKNKEKKIFEMWTNMENLKVQKKKWFISLSKKSKNILGPLSDYNMLKFLKNILSEENFKEKFEDFMIIDWVRDIFYDPQAARDLLTKEYERKGVIGLSPEDYKELIKEMDLLRNKENLGDDSNSNNDNKDKEDKEDFNNFRKKYELMEKEIFDYEKLFDGKYSNNNNIIKNSKNTGNNFNKNFKFHSNKYSNYNNNNKNISSSNYFSRFSRKNNNYIDYENGKNKFDKFNKYDSNNNKAKNIHNQTNRNFRKNIPRNLRTNRTNRNTLRDPRKVIIVEKNNNRKNSLPRNFNSRKRLFSRYNMRKFSRFSRKGNFGYRKINSKFSKKSSSPNYHLNKFSYSRRFNGYNRYFNRRPFSSFAKNPSVRSHRNLNYRSDKNKMNENKNYPSKNSFYNKGNKSNGILPQVKNFKKNWRNSGNNNNFNSNSNSGNFKSNPYKNFRTFRNRKIKRNYGKKYDNNNLVNTKVEQMELNKAEIIIKENNDNENKIISEENSN